MIFCSEINKSKANKRKCKILEINSNGTVALRINRRIPMLFIYTPYVSYKGHFKQSQIFHFWIASMLLHGLKILKFQNAFIFKILPLIIINKTHLWKSYSTDIGMEYTKCTSSASVKRAYVINWESAQEQSTEQTSVSQQVVFKGLRKKGKILKIADDYYGTFVEQEKFGETKRHLWSFARTIQKKVGDSFRGCQAQKETKKHHPHRLSIGSTWQEDDELRSVG